MKPLHAGSLIDCYNQLNSSHGKEIILAYWRASGISAAAEDSIIDFPIDPLNEIDLFDQTIEINMTSVVRHMSEKYIDKEKVSMSFAIGEFGFQQRIIVISCLILIILLSLMLLS